MARRRRPGRDDRDGARLRRGLRRQGGRHRHGNLAHAHVRRLAVGATAEYPVAHYSGFNSTQGYKMYNGNLGDQGDAQGGDKAVLVFDSHVTGIKPAVL